MTDGDAGSPASQKSAALNMKPMPLMVKNPCFLLDSPSAKEQEKGREEERELVNDQVRERKMRYERKDAEILRKTISQQRLISEGLDYWGMPIVDGDPHGVRQLMKQQGKEDGRDGYQWCRLFEDVVRKNC